MVDFNNNREVTLGFITHQIETMVQDEAKSDDVLNYLYFLRDDVNKIIRGINRKQRKANKEAK